MCEFAEKLIACLDRELPEEESVIVEQHVLRCAECRREVEIYRTLNEMIDRYCETAILAAPEKRARARRRVRRAVFLGTAAVAASVLLVFLATPVRRFLWFDSQAANAVPPTTLKRAAIPSIALEKTPMVETAAAQVSQPAPKPPLSRKPRPASTSRKRNESLWPDQAPVYIAIPADALFPPGALPEGVGFVADVNLRPDGSAQRLRLQPQLVGFEKRGARP